MGRDDQASTMRPTELPHDGLTAGEEYNFTSEGHPKSLIEGLDNLRGDAVLCDVTLRVGERTFPAHRCVLATFSPYFKAMFTTQLKESHEREVTLKGVEPPVLETLLQFFYTGSVSITQANVQGLMAASNLFQVLPVFDACSLFMEKHMDASNCLGVRSFAETMNCQWLQDVAMEFTISHSRDVVDHEEFLNLPLAKLVELVSSDALDLPREEDVFKAVLKWFKHQSDEKKEDFHKVLEHVRLPLLSPYFLHDFVAQEDVIQSSPQCRALLEEARLYHLLPDRRPAMQSVRTRPRNNAGMVEVIVCVGGRDNQQMSRSVKAFEPSSGRWLSLCDLPVYLTLHAAAATGRNVLYVAGGYTMELGSSTEYRSKRLFQFDPHVNKWEERAAMSCARSGRPGMAVLDGFVYVAGGWDGNTPLNLFERYNPETNTWETLPALKEAVSLPALVAHDGFLYLAGGKRERQAAGDSADRVQRFDPRSLSWTQLAPMTSSRPYTGCCLLDGRIYIIAAAALGGHIYVFGGRDERGEYPATVERYTPATDRWEDVTELSGPGWQMACAVIQVRKSLFTD